MTILDALDDEHLLAPLFGPTWNRWRAFLAAVYGLPLTGEALDLYRRCTGRQHAPTAPAREAWAIAGRRAGKSQVASLLAVYAAAFRDWRPYLAAGERATVAVIAADRQQARVCMRYIAGMLDAVPMLRALVTRRTATAIELRNRVVLEVHTCSFRSTRGYSFAAVIADEVAFWRSDDSANPDLEVLAALRPGLATLPGALLVGISSPYARRGALWQAFKNHHGRDGDPVLVWKADTATMNPTVDVQVIADAYETDPIAAASEYGAEFRIDLEAFVAREALEACVVPGRYELPPVPGVEYFAFADSSGGSHDSMTFAIAHAEGQDRERIVLDCVREVRPPFSPDTVVADFAALLTAYGLREVTGDRYGGEWPRERFQAHGITYVPAEKAKSDLYREWLPLLNARRVELLEMPRLIAQVLGLERRTTRGGRDSIDHGPAAHDDVANAVAGACVAAASAMIVAGPAGANLAAAPYEPAVFPWDDVFGR